jgi:hypothetical protein
VFRSPRHIWISSLLAFCLVSLSISSVNAASAPAPPTPTLDPFSIPVLPENPSPADLGRMIYYYNCMPCHGDQGQGLTDGFRQTWVEDHRNCWERGCHGGRVEDEGFPLPTSIPAVILPTGGLSRYPTFNDLVVYLQTTHPPQHPGGLPVQDYHNVSMYLWLANQRLTPTPLESIPQAVITATPGATPQQAKQVSPNKGLSLPCAFVPLMIFGALGLAHNKKNKEKKLSSKFLDVA